MFQHIAEWNGKTNADEPEGNRLSWISDSKSIHLRPTSPSQSLLLYKRPELAWQSLKLFPRTSPAQSFLFNLFIFSYYTRFLFFFVFLYIRQLSNGLVAQSLLT